MTIRAARQLAGLSQIEMAERLGICRHTYLKYEKNPEVIPVGCAKRIAKETGQKVDDLFFSENSTESRMRA